MPKDLLTAAEIAAMEERCDKATAGPWTADLHPSGPCGARVYRDHIVGPHPERRVILLRPPPAFNGRGKEQREQEFVDAKFAAHARTDVPRLLADRRAMAEELSEAKRIVQAMVRYIFDEELIEEIETLLAAKP